MASVSSSTNSNSSTASSLTAKTGMGGLVSGMDIDSIVESMTSSSRDRITKQQQSLQKLEWKQTAYRSVTTKLKEFQSKYLDVLSSTNLRSASAFNTVKASSSSDAVSVTTTGESAAGSITINSITQLATFETVKSTKAASEALTGTKTVNQFIAGLEAGESISLTLDGKVKTVTFDSDFVNAVTADASTFEANLQTLVDDAFGATGASDRVLTVDVGTDNLLSFSATGSKITLNSVGDENTTLADLGFTNGQSNKITTSSEIGDLTFATKLDDLSSYSFKINGVNFTAKSTDSLASILDKINSSSAAGVTISYSSITDKFTMTADNSGSGDNAVISDVSGNFMTALGLTSAAVPDVEYGVNAILSVNGLPITRSSNTFEVDGAKVTLKNTTASAVTLTMTEDATSLTDTIKKFVEDYNSMIDYANGLIKEEIDSDYTPLTDAQKEKMSETEITTWEKKAKSGILRGDGLLRSITSKLQSTVAGLSVNGMSLYSMGISSAGYTENGKLKIDETKLKTALETKGSEIRELFTSNKGLGNALNDIITSATKTSGVKGSRGTLVDVAGVDNTSSDTENSIYEQMKKTNKTIKTLQTRLTAEETRLWNKFTAMETAINNLNSQSSVLSQFSGSSS
jgi:flagellar hook-associated protein 2